jgi:chromate transporter
MNRSDGELLTLAGYFALLSLFAVGGANAAVPEMHRLAVEVKNWMSDRQFVEVFAIAQISPGPNVLIVTLIGYHVAGVAGALVATLAMCAPPAALSYFVSASWEKAGEAAWRQVMKAAMAPVSIGLVSASAFLLTLTIDRGMAAVALTVGAAAVTLFTRLNPLWMLALGAVAGLSGIV